jgi:hypothetical protein
VLRRLTLLLTAGLVLSACGDTPRPATQPRVTLKLSAPDDGGTTRAERVEIRGTVSPGDATVRVGGEDTEVSGGEFVAEVELQPGGNVIDVAATASGRRPASDAVRVERDMRVPVPELIGQEVEPANDALKGAGLEPVEERGDSWIDRLLGGPAHVCAITPRAGTLVEKGTKVVMQTARQC